MLFVAATMRYHNKLFDISVCTLFLVKEDLHYSNLKCFSFKVLFGVTKFKERQSK